MGTSDKYEPVLTRLLRTPAPFADESLMGYVLRLTQDNDYATPTWIFELAGLKVDLCGGGRPTLYGEDGGLAGLRTVTCLSHSEFDAIRHKLAGFDNTVLVLGSRLPLDLVRFGSPKVCPGCLRRCDYYRSIWDLLPFTACPSHKTILVDKCPKCCKRLSWVRNRVCVCRCGFDWRNASAVEVDSSQLEVSRHILRLLRNYHDEGPAVSESNPIYGLDAGDLFRALRFAADWYLFARTGKRLTTKTENALCHQTYTRAFHAFDEWPQNFNVLLDQVKRLSGNEISYSRYYRLADELCERRSLCFIAVALEDYVEKHELSLAGNGWVSTNLSRRFVTKTESCRFLRIEPKWLDLLIERGKLDVINGWGETVVLVKSESILSFKNELLSLLHIRLVAEVLGVEVADVEDLIRHGCLKAASGPEVDGLPDWSVNKKDLYSLFDAMYGLIEPTGTETPKDVIGAKIVLARLRKLNVSVGRFTADILNRKLVPIGATSRPGFAGLLFRIRDVSDYYEHLSADDSRVGDRLNRIPEYKFWALALRAMEEMNLRISSSGKVRKTSDLQLVDLNVEDLVRVANNVFGRANLLREFIGIK